MKIFYAALVAHLLHSASAVSPKASAGQLPAYSKYQGARFRWWWPGGSIEPNEISSEISDIINAGFAGGEISDVYDSDHAYMDPKTYGFGQSRWVAAVERAYTEGNKLGGHVDMTLGPHWPTGFPGYTPDSLETMKELVHGQFFLEKGESFSGTLPLPLAAPSGNQTGNIVHATPKLVAVLAARTTTTNNSNTVVDIIPDTITVLSASVSNNTLSWTAPSDGRYVVVAAYNRGTGQIQNMYDASPENAPVTYPSPAYIVDHFSSHGVQAGIDFWNSHILTDSMKEQIKQSDGSIFEDSLELKLKQYWTTDFMKEFEQRRGYDLTPFLLYVFKDTNTFSGDETVATQILNDFYQTVSDLYTDYRLGGLRKWVNSLGLRLRIQPYTASFDSAYAASIVDIPEGESLGFDGDNDAFRVLATGRDIGGRTTILSDELGAFMNEAYGVTWRFLLGTANLDMALGVSQAVIHGHPYSYSQTSEWPGFAPFTPLGSSIGFADAWGPRQPHWMFATQCSSYLKNAQGLLQNSGPSIDVAILNADWGIGGSWSDDSLNDAGYSYQFPTPSLLARHNIGVKNGLLAPSGPKYKALVVTNSSIDVSTAETLLSYGQAGLPIILVGDTPQTSFSYSSLASKQTTASSLAKLFAKIKALSTTRAVTAASGVPGALQSLAVQPSVKYPTGVNNSLISYKRTVDAGNLFWIYNNGDEAVTQTIKLEGEGNPYWIDLWTSDVHPIAAFRSDSGYTEVNITLASTAALPIYVGTSNPWGSPKLEKHITATDCESYVDNGEIHIFSNTTCVATTSNGRTVRIQTDNLPAPVKPTSWKLEVEDWGPAKINETGSASPNTVKTELAAVYLTDLVAWPNISSLVNASGIGNYSTTLTLTKKSGLHVLLDVGSVTGTYGLEVNGVNVEGVDQFLNKPIDITDYVLDGKNDIVITVATTLWNKLIEVWSSLYGSSSSQEVGLTGPVEFTYVKDVIVT
ncbi:hypothetical protein N7494_007504 [Penicillium frequentans]|uniref:Secreted protein n=1 Tax=Penicillium frequentans TaxID=3151616 RepID=A0AAD6CSN4_9EURO|nr:hypothetical protein N7494_007504 [Penicillium glabrum]